jgi:hypothetical protein
MGKAGIWRVRQKLHKGRGGRVEVEISGRGFSDRSLWGEVVVMGLCQSSCRVMRVWQDLGLQKRDRTIATQTIATQTMAACRTIATECNFY